MYFNENCVIIEPTAEKKRILQKKTANSTGGWMDKSVMATRALGVNSWEREQIIFREKMATISNIYFNNLPNVQFLPAVDNKMQTIDCWGIEESDIPILIQFLASSRADGQQRVMIIYLVTGELPAAQKFLDAIKEEFRASIQPAPQPFSLQLHAHFNIPQSEEENLQTEETLTIMPNCRNRNLEICRHPRGQHEQWAEDARKRRIELPVDNLTIRILVDFQSLECPSALLNFEYEETVDAMDILMESLFFAISHWHFSFLFFFCQLIIACINKISIPVKIYFKAKNSEPNRMAIPKV